MQGQPAKADEHRAPAPGPGLQDAPADSRQALLGHDLRAAVSDILGGLRLIDQEGLDEATRAQLERVRAAGEGLARLLEDALASMTGEDSAGATPASLPLARLLRDVELRWAGRAREKGVTFRMAQGEGLPRVIRTDRIALERILADLLSNAVKYTDEGEIGFAVALDAEGALEFRIRDDGPGFDAGRDGTAKPGSGLGLKIAHEMAGRIGGRLAVGERPAGGAELVLTIPAAAWAPPAEAPLPVGLPDFGRLKLLVAEDSETNQELMRQMLTLLGAEVMVAGDGIEALNLIDREAFDAALIDIEMPRLSGIEVIRAVRAGGGRHARMPIMAVTAYVLRANREAIYAAGADSILAKPLGGLESFAAAVTTLFDRAGAPGAEDAPVPKVPEALDTVRFHGLLEIAGPEGRIELISRLMSDLSSVERGLVLGCAGNDYAALRAQTHVLIAVAGAVGAERLMQAARLLNGAAHRRLAEPVRELCPEVLALLDDLIHTVSGLAYPGLGGEPPAGRP